MQVTASASTAAPKPDPSAVSGLRSGIANGLRSVGDGLQQAGEFTGVSADRGFMFPVEGAFTAGRVLSDATRAVKPLSNVLGKAGTIAGFIATFEGMFVGSMLRAPGATANDILHVVADQIDGKRTAGNQAGSAPSA